MLSTACRWITRCGAASILLVLFGCSSTKPYTLEAQFPPGTKQSVMMAAIDVEGSVCKVTAMTWSANPPWTPSCTVNSDQPTQKSFTIDGQEVDLVAADGGFKVSNQPVLTIPLPASTAAPATTANMAATAAAMAKANSKILASNAKNAATSAAPAAASASTAVAVTSAAFPVQWKVTLFPGHETLAAQNLSFLQLSANITIDGSACELNAAFKVRYPPYHLDCMVTTDKQGNFTLLFNPYIVAKVARSATNTITMISEGQSISGVIWDSHGFDGWTPSVPPSWRVAPKSGS